MYYYKIKYKVNRKTNFNWFEYARVGLYIDGTCKPEERAYLEKTNGELIHAPTIELVLWKWFIDVKAKYHRAWFPIYKNTIEKITKEEYEKNVF